MNIYMKGGDTKEMKSTNIFSKFYPTKSLNKEGQNGLS